MTRKTSKWFGEKFEEAERGKFSFYPEVKIASAVNNDDHINLKCWTNLGDITVNQICITIRNITSRQRMGNEDQKQNKEKTKNKINITISSSRIYDVYDRRPS